MAKLGSASLRPRGRLLHPGHMPLHQELPDGSKASPELGPGEYAINPPGAWHTADTDGPVVALFITAGKGTENRPR